MSAAPSGTASDLQQGKRSSQYASPQCGYDCQTGARPHPGFYTPPGPLGLPGHGRDPRAQLRGSVKGIQLSYII